MTCWSMVTTFVVLGEASITISVVGVWTDELAMGSALSIGGSTATVAVLPDMAPLAADALFFCSPAVATGAVAGIFAGNAVLSGVDFVAGV